MQSILWVAANKREITIALGVFLVTAIFFIGLTVFGTTVGTNIDADGTIGAATSTPWGTLAVDQEAGKLETKPVFVVGDNGTTTPSMWVSQKGVVSFGSTTPSDLFLNVADVVIGRNGSTNDLYVSGGLGVGDATTTDSNIHVAGRGLFDGGLTVNTDDLLVFNGGYVSVGSTTQWGALTVEQLTGQGELKPIFTVASNGTSSPFMFVSQKGVVSFGSSTPSDVFLNAGDVVIGRNADTGDLYVSGGFGVANATTTDGGFVVGPETLSVFANGTIGMFGTTSPILDDGLSLGGNGTGASLYVSDGLGVGNATTTNGALSVGLGDTFLIYGSGDIMMGGTTTAEGLAVEKADTIFSSGADATTTVGILTESTTKGGCIEMTSSKGNLFRLYIVDEAASTSLMVQEGSCQGH